MALVHVQLSRGQIACDSESVVVFDFEGHNALDFGREIINFNIIVTTRVIALTFPYTSSAQTPISLTKALKGDSTVKVNFFKRSVSNLCVTFNVRIDVNAK